MEGTRMAMLRSNVLARGKFTGERDRPLPSPQAPLWTVPSGYRAILREAIFGYSTQVSDPYVLLSVLSGGQELIILVALLEVGSIRSSSSVMDTVLLAGDSVVGYSNAGSLDFYLSGGLLPLT